MSSGLAYIGDSHGILSACRDLIEAAERSVVLQMYLFAANGDQTTLLPRPGAFPYADTVADWLIAKKRARPGVTVVVILDSNTPENPALTRRRETPVRRRLADAGVLVLNACLFGARFDRRRRLLPRMNFHLDHARVRAPIEAWVEHQNRWQVLHNVEDHRKNLVIDGGRAGAITSHNFIDAAFDWHENLFWLTGAVARRLWRVAIAAIDEALTIPQAIGAEGRAALRALVDDDAARGPDDLATEGASPTPTLAPVPGYAGGLRVPLPPPGALTAAGDETCALVEHEAIRARLEELFDGAAAGDELLVATTYLSDLPVIEALERAAARGARVRVLIDSIDALPLPPAAAWLIRNLVNHHGITRALEAEARWPDRFALRVHDSRGGAMMHLKTAARLGARPMLVGGQANFTPNSFSRAWLETDLETRDPAFVSAFAAHFERLWGLPASRRASSGRGSRARSALLRAFERLGLRP
ncbi:phospholipase D-like domain-containing protein [Sorangium sp. So ce1000]|uniref:phospholipase D-like domain-containing protein n=1 Tax=Sorangium sp. So ce1000 TaxID=3133325 RepID=UPI003F5ECC65